MTSREFEKHIQQAFDGSLEDDETARLHAHLRACPEALEVYCDQAILESELRRHATGARRIPGAIPAAARLHRTRQRRWRIGFSVAAAALIMLAGTITMRMIWAAEALQSPQIVAAPGTIIRTPEGNPPQHERPARGEMISIDQGVVEVHFPKNDVRAVIDGPADFRWLADDRFELLGGHAWFHVPAAAAGFRVISPSLEVIDLGTEFGMDLREDVPPAVHVFSGRVEARARHARRDTRVLSAGQAATLRPGGRFVETVADPGKFRRELPAALPELRMDLAAVNGGSIPLSGSMSGGHTGNAWIVDGKRAVIVPSPAGPGIQLDGTMIESDWPGIPGSAARTLAMWCRFAPGYHPQTAPPLALWGSPVGSWDRKFKLAVVEAPGGGTVLRVSFGGTLINGSTRLDDGSWHHIAVVYHGNDDNGRPVVRMFVDGSEENITLVAIGDTRIHTEVESVHSLNLTVGKYELPTYGRDPFLRGAIADWRIIAGALGDDEIRALATPQP